MEEPLDTKYTKESKSGAKVQGVRTGSIFTNKLTINLIIDQIFSTDIDNIAKKLLSGYCIKYCLKITFIGKTSISFNIFYHLCVTHSSMCQ